VAANLREVLIRNPVTLKELRARMRGARAFATLTVYLGLMAGFAVTLYILCGSSLNLADGALQSGAIGRTLFTGLVGLELFLITFIVPAFTAGAITGERERQTFDLLRTTLLSPSALILGKLLSALAFIFLLLLAAIPLQSIAFLFGGVSELEIVLSFVILFVTAIALGTIGLYFSARMQRTLPASVATYGVALLVMVALPLLMAVLLAVGGSFFFGLLNARGGSLSTPVQAVMWYGAGLLVSSNPLATAFVTQRLLVERQTAGVFTVTLSGSTLVLVSPWIVFTILYLVVSAIFFFAAVRRVRKINEESAS